MESTDSGTNRTGQATSEPKSATGTGPVLVSKNLGAFTRSSAADGEELIKDRYLCRGGGLMLFGGTGLGKSSLAIQLPAQFAVGRGDFGIVPARPLRSLIIQSENDDGDIAEFRDGTFAGYGYSGSEINQIQESIYVYTEVNKRGHAFLYEIVKPLLEHHRPDLLWMDHALAYFNKNPNSPEDVGQFLREWLNPLLAKHRCGGIILHHTPKPSDKRLEWSDRDYSYGGFGSVEWSGWARGVLSIEEVSDMVFLLRASKRGMRLKWRDAKDKATCRRYIAWSYDKIFWRTPDAGELPVPKKNKPLMDPEDFIGFLIAAHPKPLKWEEWWKPAQAAFGGPKSSDKPFRLLRDSLRKDGRCYYDDLVRGWRLAGV